MPLGCATHSTSCNQPTASSEVDTCEDSALFSSDIAMLYGSGEPHASMRTSCNENPGTVRIQNNRDGGGTDAQVPMYPMLSTASGPQSHSCQIPACAVGRLLKASQFPAIFWFPCAPKAELLKVALQGGSAGCSEHAKSDAKCCLPQSGDTSCLQCLRGPEHANQDFFPSKSCNDQYQCPGLLDGTLDPSTLSISAGTTSSLQRHFKCNHPGCKWSFKSQRTLDRHLKNHSGERHYACWVPGCQRSFRRRDNLNAHYQTHGTHGGRNRYVATLDKTSPIYDPFFRGQLTPQGWPLGDGGFD